MELGGGSIFFVRGEYCRLYRVVKRVNESWLGGGVFLRKDKKGRV